MFQDQLKIVEVNIKYFKQSEEAQAVELFEAA